MKSISEIRLILVLSMSRQSVGFHVMKCQTYQILTCCQQLLDQLVMMIVSKELQCQMRSPLIYIKFQAFLILQIIAALHADYF
jgi:K+-sensing histidine kinase KdpD